MSKNKDEELDRMVGRLYDGGPVEPASDGKSFGYDSDGNEVRAFGLEDSIFEYRRNVRGYSDHWDADAPDNAIGKTLRAIAVGPQDRWERRAISSTAAGGSMIPQPIQDAILDNLKSQSVLARAGVRFIPMDSASLEVTRTSSGASFGWTSEGSTSSSSDPAFTSVSLDAKTLRGVHRVNRETAMDAPDFPAALQREFTNELTNELQRVVFNGATGSGEPKGLYNSTGDGVEKLDFGGSTAGTAVSSSAAQYGEILRAREGLLNDNIPDSRHSWITSPRVDRQFAELTDANFQPLRQPQALDQVRKLVTTSVPSTFAPGSLTGQSAIFYGRYDNLAVGLRVDPQVEITNALRQENFQLSILSFLRADLVPLRPNAFRILDRIST